MKAIILMVFFGGIPAISWLPARLWTVCGDPWCLKVYPAWLDRMTYSIARPYLDQDISVAAEQMEFIEVWIASVVIIQVFTLLILLLFKNTFTEKERVCEASWQGNH